MSRAREIRLKILLFVNDGLYTYSNALSGVTGIPQQTISYHIKKLKDQGYLVSERVGNVHQLSITEQGKSFVENSSLPNSTNLLSHGVRPYFDNLHNLQFTVPIKKDAEIWFPNQKRLNGWVAKYDWFGDVYVEKTPRSVVFRLSVKAKEHNEALVKGYRVVFKLIDKLEEGYGIELGHPVMSRKPHFTVHGDGVAERVSRGMTVYTDVGHVDRSRDTGELEYYSAERVGRYIRMPDTLEDVRGALQGLLDKTDGLVGVVGELVGNQGVIVDGLSGVGEAVGQIRERLGELERLLASYRNGDDSGDLGGMFG